MTHQELQELSKLVAKETYNLNKEILSHDEAAEFLGLNKQTLYQMTCARRIPFYKPFHNRCYYRRSELEALIFSNRVPTKNDKKLSKD